METDSDRPFNLETAWQPYTCASIQDYFQQAYGKHDRAGHAYAFRGVTQQHNNLLASFDRRHVEKAVETETYLLEEFVLRAWDYLTPQEQRRCLLAEARWGTRRNTGTLVVARHRMVPTRCIDWTDCPLRALFFACNAHPEEPGEVWWFDICEFQLCVGAQWPALFGKRGHVEAEIESDFIDGRSNTWFTQLRYMLIEDDRLDRQKGWITVAGQFGTCHAEKIHRLGVHDKGRLLIGEGLKLDAIRLLEQLGINWRSVGFRDGDPADEIATQIQKKFERDSPLKNNATK